MSFQGIVARRVRCVAAAHRIAAHWPLQSACTASTLTQHRYARYQSDPDTPGSSDAATGTAWERARGTAPQLDAASLYLWCPHSALALSSPACTLD